VRNRRAKKRNFIAPMAHSVHPSLLVDLRFASMVSLAAHAATHPRIGDNNERETKHLIGTFSKRRFTYARHRRVITAGEQKIKKFLRKRTRN